MPPWGWAHFLVPVYGSYQYNLGGKPGGLFFQYGQAWTTSYYAGVTTIILLFVAIIKIRIARVWVLFGLFVSSLVIALGESGPIYSFFWKVFPQLVTAGAEGLNADERFQGVHED